MPILVHPAVQCKRDYPGARENDEPTEYSRHRRKSLLDRHDLFIVSVVLGIIAVFRSLLRGIRSLPVAGGMSPLLGKGIHHRRAGLFALSTLIGPHRLFARRWIADGFFGGLV
jgi:hypothetical protein